MLSNEPRSIEEGYSTSVSTSDLRVEADHRGAADYILAAGMNKSRFGALLLRFATEWDRSEKPKKPTPQSIDALARTYPTVNGKPTVRQRQDKAREVAYGWYSNELELLAAKLKTLGQVRTQLAIFALMSQMEDGEAKVPAVIGWWLHQQCVLCSGVKLQVVEGTGRLSSHACGACRGSGKTPTPHGNDGRFLANYMDDCVIQARMDMKKRLRPTMSPRS